MATPNPMLKAYPTPPKPVSKKSYCIAGILTTVYGLDELPQNVTDVACFWLLHPRLGDRTSMEPIAFSAINTWNDHLANNKSRKGLIAVTFDQRNHGSRKLDDLANQDWRSGNPRHAQDMFASYHGTAVDASHLLTYIPSYIFPDSKHHLTQNIVCGVSLGGHAAWHCLFHDSRITAAIVIIGCPDYARLMLDRARLTKLATYTQTKPPGSSFVGSKDFPTSLVEAVGKYDPAGLLLGLDAAFDSEVYNRHPTETEKQRLLPIMKKSLQHKAILNMSGGDDKLVPYRCTEPFLRWLKHAASPNGWFSDGGLNVEDIVFDGVGHSFSPSMTRAIDHFVLGTLSCSHTSITQNTSKI